MRTALYGLFVFVPFLLTSASFVGCGSDDTGGGSTSSSSSSGSGGGSSDPCAGHACGDPCTIDCPPGMSCGAMACDAMGACVVAANAVCSLCPAAEPVDGSACPKIGLVCDLDDGPIIVCRSRTKCTDKGWQNLAPGCSSTPPTDPACPAAEPSGACDAMTDPQLCAIGDALCGCVDPGTWDCSATPAAPCPPTAPKLGAVCSADGAKCVYGSCALGGTSGGRDCYGGIWNEQIITCP